MPSKAEVVRRIQKAFDKWGVDYKTAPGAASRGVGNMGTIRSAMEHHTAGAKSGNAPSRNVVTYGRAGLRNALCNLFLPRDGKWEIVAGGVAWHAGRVSATKYTNKHSLGTEAENTGLANDKPWPKKQYDSYVLGTAALVDEFKIPINDVVGHKEAAVPRGRKIDPTFDMNQFRRDVRGARPRSSTGIPAPKPKEWYEDMKQVREFYGEKQNIQPRTSDNILRAREGGAQMAVVGPADYTYITATVKAGHVKSGSVDLHIAEIVDGRVTRKLATTQTQGGRASVGAAWSLADSKGSLAVVADVYSDDWYPVDWVEISGVRTN